MKSSKTFYALASVITIFVLTVSQFSAALAQDPTPTVAPTPTSTPVPGLECPTSLPAGVTCSIDPNGAVKFDVSGMICDIGDNNVATVLRGAATGDTTYFYADYVLSETSNYNWNQAVTRLKYWRFDGVEITPAGLAPVSGPAGQTSAVSNSGYIVGYPDTGVPASVAMIKVSVGPIAPLTGCTITGTFYISTNPIKICNDVVVLDSNTYNIDPIIEIPQGPNAISPAVPDEQIAFPEIGKTYRIRTSGLWDNGSGAIRGPDFTAFSYSLDGVIWGRLDQLPFLCQDSDGLIWEATTDEFHIRVDDTAGNFADNIEVAELTYTLESVDMRTQCSGMFSYDPQNDWLASGQLDAASNTVHNPAATIVTGDWYALETAGQPWNYQGMDRFDIMVTAPPMDGPLNASEFSIWPYTKCWELTGVLEHKRYYFQAPGAGLSLWTSVFQQGTGRIGYNLYHVQYTDIPTDCENSYNLVQKFIDNESLDARSELGYALNPVLENPDPILGQNWVAGNKYMLETKAGPWSDEMPTRTSWNILISSQNGAVGTWYTPDEWPDLLCISHVDPVGHIRIYFEYHGGDTRYKIKVDDDDYPGNTGGMNFDVWKASDLATNGNCSDHYSVYPEEQDQDVPPNSSSGTAVLNIVADSTYRLETRGWWKEGVEGALDMSAAAISDNNGGTWYPWNEYPELLCFESFEAEGHVYYRLYFKAAVGRIYKVRALDIDSNFGNNVNNGDFGVKMRLASNTDDPWEQCTNTWHLTVIAEGLKIPANISEGVILDVQPGKNYAVEITSGSWKDGESPTSRYDAKISAGRDPILWPWYAFNDKTMPGWNCVVTHGLEPYARVYFTASQLAGLQVKIRVADTQLATVYADNTGELTYTLYGADDIDDPGDDPGDGDDTGTGYAGCNANILRPTFTAITVPAFDTPFEASLDYIAHFGAYIADNISVVIPNIGRWFKYVGGWFPYLGNSFMTFFLWCPEHDAMISAMLADGQSKEPIATVVQLKALLDKSRNQFESYNWTTENAPEIPFMTEGQSITSLFTGQSSRGFAPSALDGGLSPYNGGKIVYDPSIFSTGTVSIRTLSGATKQINVASCDAHVTVTFGSSGLIVGFCTVMNLTKLIGFDIWLNLFLLVGAIWTFIKYLLEYAAKLNKNFIGMTNDQTDNDSQ